MLVARLATTLALLRTTAWCIPTTSVAQAQMVIPTLDRPFHIPMLSPVMEDHQERLRHLNETGQLRPPKLKRRQIVEDELAYDPNILFAYFGQVKLGTPAQSFTAMFDTGSYQFWVRSTKCTVQACQGHPKYDGSQSSTYVPTNQQADLITYADGTQVQGVYAKEKASVGSVAVQGLTFEEVTDTNESLGAAYDSIMGMCWPPVGKPKSWFQTLVQSGGVTSPVMGWMIDSTNKDGAITMGGVDSARFTGTLQWVPSFGFASNGGGGGPFIYFQGLTVGGSVTTGNTNTPLSWSQGHFLSVFDTGTSMSVVPTKVAADIHAQFPAFSIDPSRTGGKYYSGWCDLSTLGNVTLSFVGEGGTVSLTLEPHEWVLYIPKNNQANYCLSIFVGNDDVAQKVTQNGPLIAGILGNSLLRKFYTVFDWGNNRTGFAVAVRTPNVQAQLVGLNSSTQTGTGTASSGSKSPFQEWIPTTDTSGTSGSSGFGIDAATVARYAKVGAPSLATLGTGFLASLMIMF
ncbi:hypothetical protein SpCBS45565_g03306 [Spizellomyces sp. 'palustris']|nr:hypothetical protein SpCBS45565_g03306 [Spizellomyces sp. 'palustris']